MSWAAIALAAFAQLAGGPWPVWLGLALFVAGLAHGAGDEQEGELARMGVMQAAAYLIVGIAVAGLFLVAPLGGLAVFFALSAWHFARSDCRFHQATRYAIAGLAVGGSALFHPSGTAMVLAEATGEQMPEYFLRALAVAGVIGSGFSAFALVTGKRGFGHAVVALLAVLLLHPVLAVGLIFLTAHAVPIQQRQAAAYGTTTVLKAIALPTAIATLGAAGIAASVVAGVIALPLAVALALGLATPHMLTERLES